jgi:hypothetical protein
MRFFVFSLATIFLLLHSTNAYEIDGKTRSIVEKYIRDEKITQSELDYINSLDKDSQKAIAETVTHVEIERIASIEATKKNSAAGQQIKPDVQTKTKSNGDILSKENDVEMSQQNDLKAPALLAEKMKKKMDYK